MHKAIVVLLAFTTAALLAPFAAPAQPDPQRTVTVVKIEDVVFTGPTTDCLDVAAFPLLSAAGERLGSGTACLKGGDFACFPIPFAGCRQTTLSTFTFNLPGGSITAPMTLKEVFTSESSLVQVGRGNIVGGTGAFVGATGRVRGGGPIRFTAEGIEANLAYVVRVT
jgi:hypothetical protein